MEKLKIGLRKMKEKLNTEKTLKWLQKKADTNNSKILLTFFSHCVIIF